MAGRPFPSLFRHVCIYYIAHNRSIRPCHTNLPMLQVWIGESTFARVEMAPTKIAAFSLLVIEEDDDEEEVEILETPPRVASRTHDSLRYQTLDDIIRFSHH